MDHWWWLPVSCWIDQSECPSCRWLSYSCRGRATSCWTVRGENCDQLEASCHRCSAKKPTFWLCKTQPRWELLFNRQGLKKTFGRTSFWPAIRQRAQLFGHFGWTVPFGDLTWPRFHPTELEFMKDSEILKDAYLRYEVRLAIFLGETPKKSKKMGWVMVGNGR